MEYKDINDYELLYMVCENTDDYMALILDKYRPMIRRKIHKWEAIAKKISVDVEDLEQEVYCAIIESLPNYDEASGATLYTYINRVVENRMKNFFRTYNTVKNKAFTGSVSLFVRNQATGDVLQNIIVDKDADVPNIVLNQELYDDVWKFCYGLPFEDACVLELMLNGYKVASIANLLQSSERRVSYLLLKNRKELKRYLLKNGLLVV